jgi:hypothetical protein
VWVQQYYRDHVGRSGAREAKGLPPGLLSIGSPYDAEARYSIKRGMAWRGYKAHFTETCPDDRPRLIVHVDTTEAARRVRGPGIEAKQQRAKAKAEQKASGPFARRPKRVG